MERKSLNCLKWGILFTFINIHIGRWNLLPEFVGMLLLYASIRSHEEPTQGEGRVAPLFLALAADYFLHWIWQFENALEGLIALTVSLYALYVLLGEVAERIRRLQPDRASGLEFLRVCAVVLQCAGFLASGIQTLDILLTAGVIGVCVALVVVVCGIRPREAAQG